MKSPWVSTDLLLTLKDGMPPGARGLAWSETDRAWTFPEDYPEEVRRLATPLGPARRDDPEQDPHPQP